MKSLISKISLSFLSVFSILGINITPAKADIQKDIQKHVTAIKETSPLYLQHFSDVFRQDTQDNVLLTWHYSHGSHESHYSHESHESHYSHYSGY